MPAIAPALPTDPPPERDYARHYVLSLPSPASRKRVDRALALLAKTVLWGTPAFRLPCKPCRVPWAALSKVQVLETVRALDSMNPGSQRVLVKALRGVLKQADAPASVLEAARPSKGTRVTAGRALSLDEIRALERAARNPRDAAMVAILVHGALRIGELVALDASDWTCPVLRVLGKGNRERRVPLEAPHAAVVDAYLAERAEGPLLTNWKGARAGERMSVRGAQFVLDTLAKRAGIGELSPHDLRRTHLTLGARAGVPIQHLAARAGHRQLSTTALYLRADPFELSRTAAQKIHAFYASNAANPEAFGHHANGASYGSSL